METIKITNAEKIVILRAVQSGFVTAEFMEYCKSTAHKEITGLTDEDLQKRLNEVNRKLE